MSHRDDYPAGVPCWVTHLSADLEADMAYYGELFGWTFDHEEAAGFAIARLDGREVAGFGGLPPAPGDQPAWVTNVRVDGVEAAAEAGVAAGGTLLAEPMDLPPAGRLTVLADPTGATVCCWEPTGRTGAQTVNEPGAWAMSALQTPDPEAAAAFYERLFGWTTSDFGPVTLFHLPGYVGGEPEQPVARDVIAGMGPATDGPAAWTPDFWVEDAERAATVTRAAGGRVHGEVEAVGPFRRAVLTDPAGATFTASQLVTAPA